MLTLTTHHSIAHTDALRTRQIVSKFMFFLFRHCNTPVAPMRSDQSTQWEGQSISIAFSLAHVQSSFHKIYVRCRSPCRSSNPSRRSSQNATPPNHSYTPRTFLNPFSFPTASTASLHPWSWRNGQISVPEQHTQQRGERKAAETFSLPFVHV